MSTLFGTAGDDSIHLGLQSFFPFVGGSTNGRDSLSGGGGNDTIDGDAGSDTINGESGNDSLIGGSANDTIDGGPGDDVIEGDENDDLINGSFGNDTIFGGADNDTIHGDAGNDSIDGGAGNDSLLGDAGGDALNGGAGNDFIYGGDGNDTVFGGAGDDFVVLGDGDDDVNDVGGGNDTYDGGAGDDYIYGYDGDELYLGGDGNDTLRGDPGNDTFDGGTGNDSIDGGAGNDTLDGGAGNDTLIGNGGADVFMIAPGGGSDTITGFEDGLDMIDIAAYGLTSYGQIAVAGAGNNTVITIGNETLTLTGVAPGAIDPSDFLPEPPLPTPPSIVAIQRVSTAAGGGEADGGSYAAVFSPDGTKVAFTSLASNLVAGDTNGAFDIFVRNLDTGAIERISTAVDGSEANDSSGSPVFSPDGSKVAFVSDASNLVQGDTNGDGDIFIKDLSTGAIERISTSTSGGEANNSSRSPVFSPDGSKVVFPSRASNLVPGDTNGIWDVFVKDLVTGVIQRISTSANGGQADGGSEDPVFSPDGTKVAFTSLASNLVAGDTNGAFDIFVRNLDTGTVERISAAGDGRQGSYHSYDPVFSPDGTKVAFSSVAANLVPGDTNHAYDIFVKDLATGAIERVSTAGDGTQTLHHFQSRDPVFSPDGTKVAFWSDASDLVPGDTNGAYDIFVKDLPTGAIERISTAADGSGGNAGSRFPVFSPDGTKVMFESAGTNLVTGDTNGSSDIFIVTLTDTAPITGTPGNDQLTGTNGEDTIDGFAGNDSLNSGAGNDSLVSGAGNDSLNGGAGDDTIVGGDGTDTVVINDLRRAATITDVGDDHIVQSADGRDYVDGSTEIVDFIDGKLYFGADNAAAEVHRLYLSTLDRAPDSGGLTYWARSVEAGTSLLDLANTFLASPEWQSKYGALDNGSFVTALYNNVLDRFPDQSGYNYWKGLLDGGSLNRPQLVVNFSESPEFKQNTAGGIAGGLWTVDDDAAFVLRAYRVGLDRDPDAGGLAYWIEAVHDGTSRQDIANAFAGAPEFVQTYGTLTNQQFVEQMYLNALDRPGDANGVAYWTAYLDSGAPRGTMITLFAESQELIANTQHLVEEGLFFV